MEIRIDGLSKRYVSHWVFRNLSVTIPSHTHLAVTGPNGAGKSTFLKMISGALHASEGTISYVLDGIPVTADNLFSKISFAAPYAEMIEEMTLPEALRFHTQFRELYTEVGTYDAFISRLNFDFRSDQQIGLMSSGMKQRLRLAFAMFTQSPLLLLDEPTSNLDERGIRWFHDVLSHFGRGRTVILASNVEEDLASCSARVSLGKQAIYLT